MTITDFECAKILINLSKEDFKLNQEKLHKLSVPKERTFEDCMKDFNPSKCVCRIAKNYNKIKKINKLKNIVIGFGITDKTISSLKKADGLVVGSQLCKGITNSIAKRQNPVTMLGKMVGKLKRKIS